VGLIRESDVVPINRPSIDILPLLCARPCPILWDIYVSGSNPTVFDSPMAFRSLPLTSLPLASPLMPLWRWWVSRDLEESRSSTAASLVISST